MKFELNGTLHDVTPTQQITDKFKKRDFILEIPNGNYTDHIKCELTQDSCSKLDNARIGNQIYAKCAVKGRLYKRKDGTQGQMNSIVAYDVQIVQNKSEFSLSQMDNPF